MIKTAEFGTIRIVNSINPLFDTFIRFDSAYEWEFYQLASGEIVALEVTEE